jgi:hypothetical protein
VGYSVCISFCTSLGLTIALAQINNFKVPPVVTTTSPTYEDGGVGPGNFVYFVPLQPLYNDRPWVDTPMLLWMLFHAVVTIVSYILFPRMTQVTYNLIG